jgi:hypothetical protein
MFFTTPVSLRSSTGGPSGLYLDIGCKFAIAQPLHRISGTRADVITAMYAYRLLDHHHTELLVYHWQPGTEYLGPDAPHLHVSASLNPRTDAVSRHEIGLDTLHLATGHVSLADVVQMLITEFEVAPQRPDWRDTLSRARLALAESILPD